MTTDSETSNPWLMAEPIPLSDFDGTSWTGEGELWLDPMGDEPTSTPFEARLEGRSLAYRWQRQGESYEGRIDGLDEGGHFRDDFHQPAGAPCQSVPDAKAELALSYEYDAGEGPKWGWRITLCVRPTRQLVLQMTNIAPWGEEARAVRVVLEQPEA